MYIVRYADDFKVFCRNYNAAKRLKIAVERWLLERLHLETSPEKSKITNLEESYSEFLGIKFKLIPKGQKWAIKSHMTDKAIKNQQKALKSLMVQACHDYGNPSVQHIFVNRYNQAVVGIHEYYSMAWIAWLLVLPVVIVRAFTTLYPIIMTFINSTYDMSLLKGNNFQFIGLGNYLRIFVRFKNYYLLSDLL